MSTLNHRENIILESPPPEVKHDAAVGVRLFVAIRAPAGLEPGCLQKLHKHEQERYARMARQERRQEWITGRWLACEALSTLLGDVNPAALRTRANGALHYADAALHLSLSHSHGLVALAVANVPVGVDVELSRPRELAEHSERIFAASEAAYLIRADTRTRLELFYRYWTLKEAFAKAAGVPVWTALRGAEFDLRRSACHLPGPAKGWQFLSARLAQDWLLGLAVQSAEAELQVSVQAHDAGGWRPQPLGDSIGARQADAQFHSITQSNGTNGEISAL